MKQIVATIFLIFIVGQQVLSCPVCKKQQPRLLQDISHGTGPQDKWDWIIVSVMAIIMLLTLVFSIKYFIRPGENDENHIKRIVIH